MENCFYLQWWDKIDDFINGAQTRFSTAWCGEWWFIICDPEWDEWINALRSHVKGEKFNMKLGWKQQVKGKSLARWTTKRRLWKCTSAFPFLHDTTSTCYGQKEHFSKAGKWALKQPSVAWVTTYSWNPQGK